MPMKIFLSCVSQQFQACRNALASDLRAMGCEVKVQEDFRQGTGLLVEQLEAYVAGCERVIVVVGDAYGEEAVGAVSAAGPRSYTQWEWFLANGERLDGSRVAAKAIYLYFAAGSFLAKHPVAQSADVKQRQQAFVNTVKDSGKHWGSFDSLDQLCRRVLRDGWHMGERPRRPCNLPHGSLRERFKGREGDLAKLRRHSPAAIQALHGLGGAGKTRLAIEHAWRGAADYSALLFVDAATPASLRDGLAALSDPAGLGLCAPEKPEPTARFEATLRWLEEHAGYLLILDNVDTPDAAQAVEDLLPRLDGGHVLVTTRRRNWSASVEPLEVGILSDDDATAFLLERTRDRRRASLSDEADARELAWRLEGLPLALEQAGAFIARLPASFADYLRRWDSHEPKVREWQWHDALLTNYPRSLAVTWDTSVAQLDAPALALLRLLCWLAPAPVPRELCLAATTVAALYEASARERGVGAVGSVDAEEALTQLGDYSLVRTEEGGAIRAHALVLEVTRSRLPPSARRASLESALFALDAYLPDELRPEDVLQWPLVAPLQPHLSVLVWAADAEGIARPTSRLMGILGRLLSAKAAWPEAEKLLTRALTLEQDHGARPEQLAEHLSSLGQLLQNRERLDEAEQHFREALTQAERCFGREDARLAPYLNNLGDLLRVSGRLVEAQQRLERALSIAQEAHGPLHRELAFYLSNLALVHQGDGRAREAEPLLLRALELDERNFGPAHPNVAADLAALAQLLDGTSRAGEAEDLLRRALAFDEASYGATHPKLARRLIALGSWLQKEARHDEAESLLRRALEIDEQSFGRSHPRVTQGRDNLARLLAAAQRGADGDGSRAGP